MDKNLINPVRWLRKIVESIGLEHIGEHRIWWERDRHFHRSASRLRNASSTMAARLRPCCIDKTEHVFERHIALDRVGRRENITTFAPKFQQTSRFASHVVNVPMGQRVLRGKTSVERQPPAIPRHQHGDIHDLRLEGVKTIDTRISEFVEQFVHIATGVDHLKLSGGADRSIHPAQLWQDKLPPMRRTHDEAMLLPPVVAKDNGIDIVLQRLGNLRNVVVGNRGENSCTNSGAS